MRDRFWPVYAVPVDDIKLDIFNFRYYGQLNSQRDCFEAMLNDKNSGIENIAKDIAEHGLTPNPILISQDEHGEWVVREGNRRIMALKILNKPSIIKEHNLYSKFNALSKQHNDDVPETVDCITCDEETTILEYLDRLHGGYAGGIGRRDWSATNKTHYDMHRGKPGENALAIMAKELVKKEGISIKEPFAITNLQRVLQNSGVQSKLKMSFDGKSITTAIEKPIFMNILKEIVIRTGEKKAKDIYVASQQQEFVDEIIKELNVDPKAAKVEPYSLEQDEKKSTHKPPPKTGQTPAKPTWDRKRLLDPRRTSLRIPDTPNNKRARDICHELSKKIDVRDATNAVAVLMRVLLEFSLENYIDNQNNSLSIKDNDSFDRKIKKIAIHMHDEGKIKKEYQDEMIRFCDHHVYLSAKNLQRLVHSPDFNPDPRTVCTLWDNIEKFVTLCWK